MSAFGQNIEGAPDNGQGAGNEGEGRPSFNFEEGYNQLRPVYTQATQQLSDAQQRLSEYDAFMESLSDPERQAEALASLGFEMDTGAATPDEEDFSDPLEGEVASLRSLVEELRQGRELEAATQEEQEVLGMRDNFIGESISYIEETHKMKFDERDEEVLGNLAIAMSDDNDVPDVEGAFNALYGETGLLERQRSQWIESKTGAFTAPMGTSIPADKRPETRAERIDWVDRRLQALDQQQN